ncbi:MAG: serine/threonine protein kinase [Planctomycetaceae bacterium]|nr:serine/threonine protein kinase [Planctomycetaceae bacterium]
MAAPKDAAGPEAAKSNETSSEGQRDLTNRMLGEFRLLRRLGKGGMAEVYLAEQTSLKRTVAVKVLRPEFVTDEAYLRRFRQEAASAGRLNHPNIVQVYMISAQDGIEYIAQEYVQGRTLKDLMNRKGPLDPSLALYLMKQIASALLAASQEGIVHRDIKPENILLTRKGEAKVADFGLAQLTLQGERVALTQVGVTMGTPLYMSPEQVAGKPVDQRSDLYSFGVMSYHMLAGRPPFGGDTALSIAVQHLNETPVELRKVRPDLPKTLCDCIHRLMAKKREDRYPDAQTLLADLRQISRQISGKAGVDPDTQIELDLDSPRRPTASLAQFWTRPLRRQVAALAIASFVAVLLGAGGGWLTRPADPFRTPPPPVQRKTPKLENVQAQLFYALSHSDDEDAWKAVIEYFPDERSERDRAETRLAVIYLRTGRLQEARAIFDQLADSSGWSRAQGLGGQAYLLWLDRQYDEAVKRIGLARTLDQPFDGSLSRLIEEINRGPLGGPPRG